MVRSVEDLERIANTEEPPLTLKELMNIREKFKGPHDRKALDKELARMEKGFRRRGDPEIWPEDLLTQIDECFIKHFYVGGAPCDSLFYPSHPSNMTSFMSYCDEVDKILRDHPSPPEHAREYFAYAMLWEKRGQRFPVPLGTSSVIEALYTLTKRYRLGLTEVCHILCLISCATPRITRPLYAAQLCSTANSCAPCIAHSLYAVHSCVARHTIVHRV